MAVRHRNEADWALQHQEARVWKLHNSVAAHQYERGKSEIVAFDAQKYSDWLADPPEYSTAPAFRRHLEWAKHHLGHVASTDGDLT